jgi:hypothetical protein
MLIAAQEAPWPVQAFAMTVICVVLFLLGRYLYRGPRTRGTSGGRDAYAVVTGAITLVLVAVVAAQGRDVPIAACVLALLSIVAGLMVHIRARRRRG